MDFVALSSSTSSDLSGYTPYYVGNTSHTDTPYISASPSTIPVQDLEYATQDGVIYQAKNGKLERVNLYGISWSGMETETHLLHGLWKRDYKDLIRDIKNAGFNAVRLPFNLNTLKNLSISGIAFTDALGKSINADLQGKPSLEALDVIMTELWRQDIRVVFDYHRDGDSFTPGTRQIASSRITDPKQQEEWINGLLLLSYRYQDFSNLVGFDLANEVDVSWSMWKSAVETASMYLLHYNPKILVFVQGVGGEQNKWDCARVTEPWWGGDLSAQACDPISSISPPEHKRVFSPHVYGPGVANKSYFKADLPSGAEPWTLQAQWRSAFGFLSAPEYRHQGALVIGEFGERTVKNDGWLANFLPYLQSNQICNFFYWGLGANSGDVGGIYLDDEWRSMDQAKLALIKGQITYCDGLQFLEQARETSMSSN